MNKAQLKQYCSLEKEIAELKELRQTYIDKIFHSPLPDGMPRAKGAHSDPVGNTATKIVDLTALINEKLDILAAVLIEIENAIDSLPPEERRLMRKRYIENKKWEVICVEMNYCWRQVHYFHSAALKKIAF